MSQELWIVDLGRGIGPIDLGATREEVAQRLKDVGIELDIKDEEDWLWVEEIDAELYFREAPPHVLTEIIVEGDHLQLGPLQVMGKRLHEVVDLLQVSNTETLWRSLSNECEDEDPGPGEVPTPKDEDLLDWATLWIPSLGIGLSMLRGEIDTVRLRKPEDAPRKGVGMLTPSQRELSTRKDLPTCLRSPHGVLSRPVSRFQTVLTITLGASLVWLFWKAFDYQRQWNQAPVVEGTIVAVDPPPPEPFPMKFTVAYRDLSGADRTTVLERADIYVNSVGEKVDIRYLPNAPDQPMGPASVSDAAFVKYFPWGIGLVAAYLIFQVLASTFAWLLDRMRAAPSTAATSQT